MKNQSRLDDPDYSVVAIFPSTTSGFKDSSWRSLVEKAEQLRYEF